MRRRARTGAAIALAAPLALAGSALAPPSPWSPWPVLPRPAGAAAPRATVEIAGETFELELALDEATRARGLAGRAWIPADGGMLFVYPRPDRLVFWMDGCLVDIDLVLLDADGRIVRLHAMPAERPRGPRETRAAYERRLRRYRSGRPAQLAIELRAGTIARLGLRRGQVIELDRDALVARAR